MDAGSPLFMMGFSNARGFKGGRYEKQFREVAALGYGTLLQVLTTKPSRILP